MGLINHLITGELINHQRMIIDVNGYTVSQWMIYLQSMLMDDISTVN